MKQWVEFVRRSVSRFSVFDFGMLKLCLISIGVLIGVYLHQTLDGFMWLFWLLFVSSWLYIVVRTFTVQEK